MDLLRQRAGRRVAVGLAALHLVDAEIAAAQARLDLPARVTLMAGLVALVYGDRGRRAARLDVGADAGPGAAAAALLAAFAAIERRAAPAARPRRHLADARSLRPARS